MKLLSRLLPSAEQTLGEPPSSINASWRTTVPDALELVLTWTIAAVFIRSAAAHLNNPYYFLSTVLSYRLTGPFLSESAALFLPVLQVFVAACLLMRILMDGALILTLLMSSLFALAQLSAIARGLKIGCGCFGAVGEQPVGLASLLTVAFLGVAALVSLVLRRSRRSGFRADKAAGTTSRRDGITLLETLIVTAIIGLLAALLLPALQSARESARRIQCANNFRQVGIALTNYSVALGTFPVAVTWSPAGEPLGGGQYPIGVIDRVARYGEISQDTVYANWLMMILPYLERDDLHRLFSPNVPISAEENRLGRMSTLSVAICPSDIGGREMYQRGGAAGLVTNLYARGNIAINVGPDRKCVEGLPKPSFPCRDGFFISGRDLRRDNVQVWGTGIAGVNKSFRPTDVTDGLSQTVAVDEIRAGVNELDPRGCWALGQVGASLVARHGKWNGAGGPNDWLVDDEFIGCEAVVQLAESQGGSLATQGMACSAATLVTEVNALSIPRSLHPGGVNVVLCDGSVHFLRDSIAAEAWHALHSRSLADYAQRLPNE